MLKFVQIIQSVINKSSHFAYGVSGEEFIDGKGVSKFQELSEFIPN